MNNTLHWNWKAGDISFIIIMIIMQYLNLTSAHHVHRVHHSPKSAETKRPSMHVWDLKK